MWLKLGQDNLPYRFIAHSELSTFSNWAKKKGIAINFVKTTSDVIRELNKSKRDNDKITELSIFSHGTASNVAFGYENTRG